MPTVQFRGHCPSESSNLGAPSLGGLGRSAQAPALSCWRGLRREGPEGDLWRAGRRRSRRGGGRRRGDERKRRGPGGAVRRRLGGSGWREGWGCCEGGHPVNRGQGGRGEERRRRWRTLLARGQRGEAEGCRRRVACQQGQIPSPTGERRRGGGLGGGGDLREGRPRPGREGKGGGRGRLQEERI